MESPNTQIGGRLRGRTRGFTLVELMVVVLIILLVSAAVLPVILPALQHRAVTEAGRMLQGGLVQARAAATKHNAPRGIRLLPDPTYASSPTILAFNRWVPIEPGPDYSNGHVTIWPVPQTFMIFATMPTYPVRNPDNSQSPYPYYPPNVPSMGISSPNNPSFGQVLMIEQAPYIGNDVQQGPDNPTTWFWNVRIGDKIQVGDLGQSYTVVGPMTVANPELFVNDGVPGSNPQLVRTYTDANGNNPQDVRPEYLFLVNGIDDDQDGLIDSGWDGLDYGKGVITSAPGVQPTTSTMVGWEGVVDNVMEWETETWMSTLSGFNMPVPDTFYSNGPVNTPRVIRQPMPYLITRRPVPSPNVQETALPTNVVIDATTWNSTRERSRLPIDPNTHTCDILLNPTGQIVISTVYSSSSSVGESGTFLHFWLSERPDVHESTDLWGPTTNNPNAPGSMFKLPIPAAFAVGLATPPSVFLTGERMVATLFGRTGQVTTNSVEFFSSTDVNQPFYDSQLGAREAK